MLILKPIDFTMANRFIAPLMLTVIVSIATKIIFATFTTRLKNVAISAHSLIVGKIGKNWNEGATLSFLLLSKSKENCPGPKLYIYLTYQTIDRPPKF